MKNLMKTIAFIAINLCFCNNILAHSRSSSIDIDQYIYTESHFKIAKAYWLPDHVPNDFSSIKNGDSSAPTSCSGFGLSSTIPTNMNCAKTNPGFELICYKDCFCPSKYSYADCSNGQKLSADCCGGKCSACETCTATGGWSYTKPNADDSRIRKTTQPCGDVFYACSAGFKPYRDSILGSSENLTSCPTHQNYINTNGGTYCAKCVDKSCADYNFQDNKDTTMNCTTQTPYTGKTCYSCQACDGLYKYDSTNCPAPNTLGGSSCGRKYSECNKPACTPLANETSCTYGITTCSDTCGGTRTCCKSCTGSRAEVELRNQINSQRKGIIRINESINFCPNTGLKLFDGQSLVGAKGVTLKFDFDSSPQGIGIELANNTSLSDLTIDYTSGGEKLYHDYNVVRNNQGNKNVKIKNINIIINTNMNMNARNKVAGIRNYGDIELSDKIDITDTNPRHNPASIIGIHGKDYAGYKASLIQSKDSTLNINVSGHGILYGKNILSETVNIKTYGVHGYGIFAGTNTLSGTINIETHNTNGYGLYLGRNTISGITNINTHGIYGYGTDRNDLVVSGTLNINTHALHGTGMHNDATILSGIINIQTFGKWGYATSYSAYNITATGKLFVNTKSNTAKTFSNATFTYEKNAQIAVKTISAPVANGLWKVKINNKYVHPEGNNTIKDWIDFDKIGPFPTTPFFN